MLNCFSPEFGERSAQFSEVLKAQKIKAFSCDFDDTFINTHEVFVGQIEIFKDALCTDFGMNRDLLNGFFYRVNVSVHSRWSVSPNRWEAVVARLARLYKVGDGFDKYLPILDGIYDIVPKVKEGTFEFLEMLKEADQKVATVTHANEPWTWFKLQHTGLGKYFDTVAIADETRHKGVDDWKRSLVELGVEGCNAINVGDNIKGDIQAGYEAGFKYQVHVPPAWGFYGEGDLPETALLSPNGIAGVADVLIEKLS